MLSPKNTTRSPERRWKLGGAGVGAAASRAAMVRANTGPLSGYRKSLRRARARAFLPRMSRLASYRLGGGDHPTVLLHGFLGSGKNLRTLAQRWSERDSSRVFVMPDLTGHGASPPLPPDAGVDTLAADLRDT